MPLSKILYKPGVNRENTRYTNENGWYVSDKVRFRQGTPEKIGGWARISSNTFLGVCRSLWNWVTLTANNLMGVGTSAKYYIESGGAYNDITPIRRYSYTTTLTNPFSTTNGQNTISVSDTAHGAQAGSLVYFTGSSAVGGIPAAEINTRHTITSITDANTYVITVTTVATSTVSGAGGTVTAQYFINGRLLGTDPFATTNGSNVVTVTATDHGGQSGDYVTFSGATTVAGLDMNAETSTISGVSTTYSGGGGGGGAGGTAGAGGSGGGGNGSNSSTVAANGATNTGGGGGGGGYTAPNNGNGGNGGSGIVIIKINQ